MLELIQSAVSSIPDEATAESELLNESDILGPETLAAAEPSDMDACDSLDTMMCKIVDDMT